MGICLQYNPDEDPEFVFDRPNQGNSYTYIEKDRVKFISSLYSLLRSMYLSEGSEDRLQRSKRACGSKGHYSRKAMAWRTVLFANRQVLCSFIFLVAFCTNGVLFTVI